MCNNFKIERKIYFHFNILGVTFTNYKNAIFNQWKNLQNNIVGEPETVFSAKFSAMTEIGEICYDCEKQVIFEK